MRFKENYEKALAAKLRIHFVEQRRIWDEYGVISYTFSKHMGEIHPVAAVFGGIFGIIILISVAILFYTQLLVPIGHTVPLKYYVPISVLIITLFLCAMIHDIRGIKRIDTLSINENTFSITVKGSKVKENYQWGKDTLSIKRSNKNGTIGSSEKAFIAKVTSDGKKREYRIYVDDEQEFFVFYNFICAAQKNQIPEKLECLTDKEICERYYTIK